MKYIENGIVINGDTFDFVGNNSSEPQKYDIAIKDDQYYIYNNGWTLLNYNLIPVSNILDIDDTTKNILSDLGIWVDLVDNNVVDLTYHSSYSIHEYSEDKYRFIYLTHVCNKCNIKIMFNCIKLKDSAYRIDNHNNMITWRLGK